MASPMAEASLVILENAGKELSFQDLFAQVITHLELDEAAATKRIAKVYAELTLDKRFISLPGNMWDLRKRHRLDDIIVLSEDLEDEDEFDDFDEEEIEEEMIDLDGFDPEKVKEYEEDVKELSKMAIYDEDED